MSRDTDLLVDIELPDDIAPGTDEGGLPITVPANRTTEAKTDAAVPTLAELEQARRERDTARQSATRFETESKTHAQALADAQAATEAERGKRTQAEHLAHQRTVDTAAMAYHRVNAELSGVTTNISTYKSMAAQAEANLQAAHEANDPARIARASTDLARANSDLVAMEQAEGQWKAELAAAKRAYEGVVAQAPRVEEPAVKKDDGKAAATTTQTQERAAPKAEQNPDAWIDQWPRKTTGAWLREHKDYVTDQSKHDELIRFANEYAADYGQHMVHTQAFIEELNRKFFPATQETQVTQTGDEGGEEIDTTATQQATTRTSTASAPVSRSTTTGKASGNNTKVRLSPAEAQAAEDLFGPGSPHNLAPAEARKAYAINKLRAERDGKYSLNPQAQQ